MNIVLITIGISAALYLNYRFLRWTAGKLRSRMTYIKVGDRWVAVTYDPPEYDD